MVPYGLFGKSTTTQKLVGILERMLIQLESCQVWEKVEERNTERKKMQRACYFFFPSPAPAVVPPRMPPMSSVPSDQQNQQYAPRPSQQQWMTMQSRHQQQEPPPAGWAPQSFPPPLAVHMLQPLAQQYATGQNASSGDVRLLWIGDLQPWMDENYLINCCAHTGEVISVKVIRNKQTGMPEGYGFVEFRTRAAAETMLQTYNGTLMPNSDQNFRLNWAIHGPGEKRQDDSQDYTIFVGDLAADGQRAMDLLDLGMKVNNFVH
ncbi:hypothetical protein L6164_029399 [Bauhinia variegata]|uniref:Uncharacterized protein n=1 Tax=Bauhinia variegata TaxID=167791 RepID=A0ACB9L995_BAUVA|nr:hypothetical protein L6164_029399 [Bauhinia variegata]